ncbi:hypothetical protein [Sporolactobacillus pectinivorans]|uniref:hypothetical protein n=1 Tax=Sporolactobacillus pectinivorans TaxID=1591408 RepID=UPI001EFDE425|nr:hypothetical protein [Sporolactobacillus pectinivorans]
MREGSKISLQGALSLEKVSKTSEIRPPSAKDFFLLYSGERLIEETRYGALIENKRKRSRIYVNGLCVAEEDNLLFSYNITSLTKKLLPSLNRERTNVGRSAYSDKVKSILLECSSPVFARKLVEDLQRIQTGDVHDEFQWIDVQLHANLCSAEVWYNLVIILQRNERSLGKKAS